MGRGRHTVASSGVNGLHPIVKILAVAVTLVCGWGQAIPASAQDVAKTGFDAALQNALSGRAPQGTLPAGSNLALLRKFYAARNDAPLWTDDADARQRGEIAMAALRAADTQGLDGEDYQAAVKAFAAAPSNDQARAARELAVTGGLLRYASDIARGRVGPDPGDPDRALPVQSFDAAAALADALRQRDVAAALASLAPPYSGYQALVAALSRYRAIETQGGWPAIVSADREIALDGSDPRAALLHQRLAAEDPAVDVQSDDALAADLKRYQTRNGLVADGRAGPKTLAMLNTPAPIRIAQIIANLERWRWLPRAFEARYIVVQLPDGRLRYVADHQTRLESRVIFGRPRDPTPVLRTEAIAVTVNPPWSVPRSIAVGEILPALRKDAGYLVRHRMVLLNGPIGDPYGTTIDWKTISAGAFNYRVQQLPGPDNALGQIKIEMPNRFTVYLHDTPQRGLFQLPDRALSHGCVRVQEILPLASLALTGDASGAQSILTDAIAAGATGRLDLPARLPVYLLYWTAIPDKDGLVGFRADIYRRDARLIALLKRASAS